MLPALTALIAGIAMIIAALANQQHVSTPQPSVWGTIPTDTGKADTGKADTGKADTGKADTGKADTRNGDPIRPASGQAGLPASKPVGIKIPAIHVDSSVFPIGKDSHGGLQVPLPGPNLNKVAWYAYSPTPGQTGPAVLEGHVDTVHGPSVFLHLGALTPGNKIKIVRADNSVAVFIVDAVRGYQSHDDFPTDLVYSGDLSRPTLRIITCSNFNHRTGHYVGNTIVFAHLATTDR